MMKSAQRVAGKRLIATAAAMISEAHASRGKGLLVDGNNALYHFYNPLSTIEHDGIKTGAADGLLVLLQRLDKTHRPDHISVVFDTRLQSTARKVLQPTYKMDRAPTPRSLVPQFAYAKKILSAASINCIELPGVEADDIIATYAAQYTAAGFDVLVVSNDNDFLQLVHDGVTEEADLDTSTDRTIEVPATIVEIYQPSKRRYIRERNLRGRFGLHPKLLPDFHSLCGHQWKRIPRVENMTDEVAAHLLTKYGGLYHLLRQLDTLDDLALSKTLKQCITSIESSYRIVKLVDNVSLTLTIDKFLRPQLN